ncbi:MAG TPA: UDP-N-acetylglucosamine 2-epimerase (non-hydrolyzing), partial [Candidatus Acetothermia bacterium]|nr:UDP-N-acetylglucosamine 2-epimerase (non-hydrolyzing) [Candidatus Acetothermia bacterium]
MTKMLSIVGARPQFIKVAPIIRVIEAYNKSGADPIEHVLIHTGQHYDYELSQAFFVDLDLPKPNYNLGIGSGSHGVQTGEMLKRIEDVLLKEKPDLVMVYGDTNSTLAGALAAAKLHIPVAHVEAGLRSFNKRMPEEVNRVLTDHVSDLLFCPTETAVKNLQHEGFTNILNDGHLIPYPFTPYPLSLNPPPLVNVGDVMYDSVLHNIKVAEKHSNILERLHL